MFACVRVMRSAKPEQCMGNCVLYMPFVCGQEIRSCAVIIREKRPWLETVSASIIKKLYDDETRSMRPPES